MIDRIMRLEYLIFSRISGRLAQLGERYPYKVDVGGSIPSTPTTFQIINPSLYFELTRLDVILFI